MKLFELRNITVITGFIDSYSNNKQENKIIESSFCHDFKDRVIAWENPKTRQRK